MSLSFLKWNNIDRNVEKVFKGITYFSVFNDIEKEFTPRGIREHSIYSIDRNECFLGLIPFFFSNTVKKQIYDQVKRTGSHGISPLQVSSIPEARHFVDSAKLPEGFFESNSEEARDLLQVFKEVFLKYCRQGSGVYGSIVTFTWKNGNEHVGLFAMVHNGTEITDLYFLDPQVLQFGKDADIHFSKNEGCIDVFKSAKNIQFMVSTINVTHEFPYLERRTVNNNNIHRARRRFSSIASRQGSNHPRPQSAGSKNRPRRIYDRGEHPLFELNNNTVRNYRNRHYRDNENDRDNRAARNRTPSPDRNRNYPNAIPLPGSPRDLGLPGLSNVGFSDWASFLDSPPGSPQSFGGGIKYKKKLKKTKKTKKTKTLKNAAHKNVE